MVENLWAMIEICLVTTWKLFNSDHNCFGQYIFSFVESMVDIKPLLIVDWTITFFWVAHNLLGEMIEKN
jgi:hypothetical protein